MGIREAFSALFAKPEIPYSGEIARSLDDIYRKWTAAPYNPDLLAIKKGGLGIYKKMREDDQIKACLQLKKAAIITPGWTLDEGEEEHREFIEYSFASMDGTVEDTIFSILSAFDYGFSVQEKIFSYIEKGKYEGKIGLKAIRPKSPTRIEFELDEFGNLKPNGILQRQDTGKYLNLPIDKFVLYSYQKEFDNLYGESDLKSVYRLWFVKTNVLKYWAIYLERFSVPIVMGRTNTGRVTDPQREEFKVLISNIQAGMSGLLPQDLSMEFMESARVDRGVFDQAISSLNIGIARGILIPQLIGLVPLGGTGSYGKSETELRTFDWVLGTIAKNVADVMTEQVVRQLIDINYGEQEEYPRFTIKPIKEEDKARLVASWSEAVARGAVTTTPETQQHIRDLLAFPEPTDEEIEAMETARDLNLDIFPPIQASTGTPEAQGQAASARRKKGNGGAKGVSGVSGKNPSGGQGKMSNVPGKANQYSQPTLPGPESRVDWERYVAELDGIEDEARRELTDAFSHTIFKMIDDAKKKSYSRNDSSSPTQDKSNKP